MNTSDNQAAMSLQRRGHHEDTAVEVTILQFVILININQLIPILKADEKTKK